MKRTLTGAKTSDYRAVIASYCFHHAATAGDVSLCLYDVTTLYFEAEKEDTCAKSAIRRSAGWIRRSWSGCSSTGSGSHWRSAASRATRPKQPPLIPIIDAFQHRHGLTGVTVVADAGMLSAANLRALDEAGLRFIVGSRMTKAPIDLESHFRWHGEAFDDGQIIDTITPKTGREARSDPQARRARLAARRPSAGVAGGVGVLPQTRRT